MKRILIVDDHSVVRRGIKQILLEGIGPVDVGEARDAQECELLVAEQLWDLVILDINLPGKSGLALLVDLHEVHPSLPVLMMSMFSEEQYALRVLKAGASGYLNKQSAPEELIHAISKIFKGGKYINDAVANLLLENSYPDRQKIKQELSDREYQVLVLIASGSSLSAIADALSLSVKTVNTYRARLLKKIGLKNNAELIHYAVFHNLL
jgi:DNA-binding NarL/FixJ family response regulator